MRYFMEIVRGIFLKGSGLDVLWPQMAALAVMGVVVLGARACSGSINTWSRCC